MINLTANVTIINQDQIHFFENEPGQLEEINRFAERIAKNETIFFDTKESYSKFLNLVPIDSSQRSKIQQIFKERLGPVEEYRIVKLQTLILDPQGKKLEIEVPLEMLKKKFDYFKGFESFNQGKKALNPDLFPINLSPESLIQFINYVYGKEWKITNVKIANELLEASQIFLNEHFRQAVILNVIHYFAAKENEFHFDEIYVNDNADIFIEEYLKNRNVIPQESKENHKLFTLYDLLKIFSQNQSPKLAEFLVKNISSIEVEITQESDLALLAFLPGWLKQKIVAFGICVEDRLSEEHFSIYTFLSNRYPALQTYALVTDVFPPTNFYECVLNFSYLNYTKSIPSFPIDMMFQHLDKYLQEPNFKNYILKELSNYLINRLDSGMRPNTASVIQILEKQLNPKDSLQLTVLGLSYYIRYQNNSLKKDADKAFEYFSAAIGLNPDDLGVVLAYAQVLFTQGNELAKTEPKAAYIKYVEAEKFYLKAISAGVKNRRVIGSLIFAMANQSQYLNKTSPKIAYLKFLEVETWCREAIAAGNTNPLVFESLAYVLSEHGNHLHKNQTEEAFSRYVELEKLCLVGIEFLSKFSNESLVIFNNKKYLASLKSILSRIQKKIKETQHKVDVIKETALNLSSSTQKTHETIKRSRDSEPEDEEGRLSKKPKLDEKDPDKKA